MASGSVGGMHRSECARLLVADSGGEDSSDEDFAAGLSPTAADPDLSLDPGGDFGTDFAIRAPQKSANVAKTSAGSIAATFVDRLQSSAEWARVSSVAPQPRKRCAQSLSLGRVVVAEEKESAFASYPREWYQSWRHGAYVIVPQMGVSTCVRNLLDVWDLIMTATIIMTAVVIPLELTIVHMPPLKAFDRVVDTAFLLDILLQFFIAVPNHRNEQVNDFWERDPVMIARLYVGLPCGRCLETGGGMFWRDILSLSSFLLPTFYPAVGPTTLLLVRVFRLMRVLSLGRLKRAFDRLQGKFGYSYHAVNLAESLALTMLACHWLTCVWISSEGSIYDDKTISYHSESGRTWLVAMIEAKGDPCHPSVAEDPMCMYSLALYFTVMTLTTVGYGDIAPQNIFEYRVVILMIMVSAILWTMLMGSIVNVLAKFDPLTALFRQNLDDLNEMCTSKSLPTELRSRLRSYMHESKYARRNKDQRKNVMEHVSPGLQGEVALQCVGKWLDKYVYWSKDLEEGARIAVASCLNSLFYPPDEYIVQPTSLVILMRGIAAHFGRIFSKGKVWGHDRVLLDSPFLIDAFSPKTLSYVEVLVLSRSDIRAVCSNFPTADKKVRRAQIRFATCRAIVHVAHAIRRLGKAKVNTLALGDLPTFENVPTGGLGGSNGRANSPASSSPRLKKSRETSPAGSPLGKVSLLPRDAPSRSRSSLALSMKTEPLHGAALQDPLTPPGKKVADGVRFAVSEVLNAAQNQRSFAVGSQGGPPGHAANLTMHLGSETGLKSLEERVANVVRNVMAEVMSQDASRGSPPRMSRR